ncbi:unnamed protein product [Blepharisma stoltei]|uniref:HTH OST-type domain-containing protein n=1 Tax=Blepharisma stoltei TaxID=1481888 RepID=A0AAU9IAN8_9CILI|nr:unnamed protein product [Blepharisma stoltei]
MIEECKKSNNFQVSNVNDLKNDVVSLIFPSEEQWFSYDQHIKAGDPLNIKSTKEWSCLVDFFKDYFKSDPDKSLAIQGGRYGCAQLVKFYGPTHLSEFSLGKLSYMVQIAIDEDIIRYNKALLVLNPRFEYDIEEESFHMTLEEIKTNIIEVLKEAKNGIPLAQIPSHLKKKSLNQYHIAKFGFPKLKDLLQTIENIKIETKEAFQAYAFYESKIKLEDIVAEINTLEDVSQLEQHLFSKFGKIEWQDYGYSSLYEFLNLNHLRHKLLDYTFPREDKLDFHKPFAEANFTPLFLKESLERKNSIYEIGTTSEDQYHVKFVDDLLSESMPTERSQIRGSRLDPDATPFFLKIEA